MGGEVGIDCCDEVGHGAESPAAQGLVGQLPEPAFDEVQSGAGGRGEVQVEPGVLGRPGLDVGVLVGGSVSYDEARLAEEAARDTLSRIRKLRSSPSRN